MQLLKVSEYAKIMGVTPETVYVWRRENILPEGVTTLRTPTGRIRIRVPDDSTAPDIIERVADAMDKATKPD